MGEFKKHYTTGRQRFPVVSLWLVVPVYMGTNDPTLVVVTLVLGSVVTRASAVVPDIDSHDSIPRRKFGRLLTVWVLVVFFLTSVDLVVPGPLLTKLLSTLPVGFTPSALFVLLLLWSGLASRHRSMTHSIVWGAALAVAFGGTGFFALSNQDTVAAATVGSALATYTFVGFYSHLSVDEEDKIVPTRDGREPDEYEQYLEGWTEKYHWLTVPTVIGAIVFTESSLFLLVGLALAYCGLIAGLMLPRIDRKRSMPRRVFDVIGVAIVAGLLFQQLFAAPHPTLAGEVPVLELPPGTVPAFYLFVLVLWLGREGTLLKQLGLGRITHTLHWPAAVCASFVVLLVTSTAALLPIKTTAYLAVVGTSSMLYGFYHYFRMEGIIATPDDGTD